MEWCTYAYNTRHAHLNNGNIKIHTPVVLLEKNGEIVKEYKSMKEAAQDNVGCNISGISKCCNGKTKSHNGKHWAYKDKIPSKERSFDVSEWSSIPGYVNYKISRAGEIYSVTRNNMMKISLPEGNYPKIHLHRDGFSKIEFVHVLVAKAYIPNPRECPEVNHINGNKHDFSVKNLEWVTHKENNEHAKTLPKIARSKKMEQPLGVIS